jgi:predicted transcriptional regulator
VPLSEGVFDHFSNILSQLTLSECAALKELLNHKSPVTTFPTLGKLQALGLIMREDDAIRLTDTGRVIASCCQVKHAPSA